MQKFRQHQVWQAAHQRCPGIHRLRPGCPREAIFGLTRQLRRAATSIIANLAEGRGRGSEADLARFLSVAMGSACEQEPFPGPAKDLEFMTVEAHRTNLDALIEIQPMLGALIQKLAPSRRPGPRRPSADG